MEQSYNVWLESVAANLAVEVDDIAHMDNDLRLDFSRGLDPYATAQQYL